MVGTSLLKLTLAQLPSVSPIGIWHLLFYALCISITLAAKARLPGVLNHFQLETEVWPGKPSLDLGLQMKFSSSRLL